ncbi:unnamed protein product [Pedinophyceae sp. YPF-701]|nr:unnamed protein product [Pedinophyceae sp. YPF-701]
MGPRRPMTPPTPESGRSQGGPKLGAEASQIAAEITRGLDRLSATGEDWEARCAAMEKIESAVEGGGPAAAQALATLVKALKRPLAVQLQDRRSAVAKQATQLVACLARSMSASFEPLAVHLLPVLCKLAVITIQVISDSADACAREILATCYSARLAQAVCDAVQGKHKDLRAAAASWLTLVVDSWPPPVLERASDALNAALLSGCQDASASVREHAREALAIYAAVSPVSTRPLLAQVLKVDPQLHAKLKRVVDGTAHHSSARSGASRNSGGSGAPAPPARSNGASEPQRRSLPGVSGGVRPQTAPPARLPAAHNGRAAPAFERSDGANALSDSAGSGDSATSSGGSQRRTPRLFQIAQPRSATASPAQDRLAALREKRRRNSRAPDSSSNTTAHSQRETPPAAAAQPPQQPPGTPAFPSGPSPDAATEDLVRSALKSAQRTLGRPPLSLEEIANSPSPMDYLITPNASDVTADRVFSAMATIKAEEARAAAATATLLAERERAGRARGGGESEVPGGEFCIESAEADAEAFRRRAEQELRQRGADRGLSPSLTAGRASAESYDTGVLVADPPGTSAAARMRAEGAAGVLASDDAPQTPDVSTAAAALRAGTPWQGGSAGPRRAGSGEEVPKTTGFLEPEERLMVAAGGIGGAPRAETVDRSPMPYNAPMERVTPGHVLPASEGSPRPRAGAAPALGGARRVPVPRRGRGKPRPARARSRGRRRPPRARAAGRTSPRPRRRGRPRRTATAARGPRCTPRKTHWPR